jgi:hypothetical protein
MVMAHAVQRQINCALEGQQLRLIIVVLESMLSR